MQIGEEAGARAVVHSQDKMPFPEDEGIMAKPGYMTSIGISQVDQTRHFEMIYFKCSYKIYLSQVSIERRGEPYTSCFSTDQDFSHLNVYEEHYNVKYSNLVSVKMYLQTSTKFQTCQFYLMFKQGCYKTCYQRNVIEECGCADASLPMTGKAFDYVTVKPCNTSDIVQG